MKRLVVYEKEFWSREEVAKDVRYFIFGDNLKGYGMGGQAIIRGLPNAFGVPTKKTPSMDEGAFFTDDEYEANCQAICAAFEEIPTDRQWVIARAGLGTGLAQLDIRAPRTFQFLTKLIDKLMSDDM